MWVSPGGGSLAAGTIWTVGVPARGCIFIAVFWSPPRSIVRRRAFLSLADGEAAFRGSPAVDARPPRSRRSPGFHHRLLARAARPCPPPALVYRSGVFSPPEIRTGCADPGNHRPVPLRAGAGLPAIGFRARSLAEVELAEEQIREALRRARDLPDNAEDDEACAAVMRRYRLTSKREAGNLGAGVGAPPAARSGVFARTPGRPASAPFGVAFAFSVSVGVVFGIYPAVVAARREPWEALRSE